MMVSWAVGFESEMFVFRERERERVRVQDLGSSEWLPTRRSCVQACSKGFFREKSLVS